MRSGVKEEYGGKRPDGTEEAAGAIRLRLGKEIEEEERKRSKPEGGNPIKGGKRRRKLGKRKRVNIVFK